MWLMSIVENALFAFGKQIGTRLKGTAKHLFVMRLQLTMVPALLIIVSATIIDPVFSVCTVLIRMWVLLGATRLVTGALASR